MKAAGTLLGVRTHTASPAHIPALSQRAQGQRDQAGFQPQLPLLGHLGQPSHVPGPRFPHLCNGRSGAPSLAPTVPFSSLFFALFHVPLSTTVPLHLLVPLHKMLFFPLCWLFSPDPFGHCFNFISSEKPDSLPRLRHTSSSAHCYLSLFSLHFTGVTI